MAAPTFSSAGIVLNKKNQKASRFFVKGTNFIAGTTVTINDPRYNWDATTKVVSTTLLAVKAKFHSAKPVKTDDTGDITVTVTNADGNTTSPAIPVAYVDEDD
jgi:hypothetical protein